LHSQHSLLSPKLQLNNRHQPQFTGAFGYLLTHAKASNIGSLRKIAATSPQSLTGEVVEVTVCDFIGF